MSQKLSRSDLMSLEVYAEKRPAFREQVMTEKKNRRVGIGENANLYFENRLTLQYQVQEMLRAERIFDAAGIEEELDAYNPLIPDGKNLKATFMLEYPDVEVRKKRLAELRGIEDKTYLQVEGFDKVYAISDEDLERTTDEKTSAVHFCRFEFSDDMISALRDGSEFKAGIEHENFPPKEIVLSEQKRNALLKDFYWILYKILDLKCTYWAICIILMQIRIWTVKNRLNSRQILRISSHKLDSSRYNVSAFLFL